MNRIFALVMFGSMLAWATQASARQVGTVSSYNPEKGIGIIQGQNGESITFHKSDWSLLCPAQGVRVTYDPEQRARGLVAAGIIVVDGSPASCGGTDDTRNAPAKEESAESSNQADIPERETDQSSGASVSEDTSDESFVDETDVSEDVDDSEPNAEDAAELDQEGEKTSEKSDMQGGTRAPWTMTKP